MLSILASSLFASMAIITPASATQSVEMIIKTDPGVVELEFEPLPSGLVKITFYTEQTWTGDWVGTVTQSGTAMGGRKNGIATIKATGTFEGTIDGKVGTVSYRMRNNIRSDGRFFGAYWTILGGTGELENIHGNGTVAPEELRIWVHFDP